MLKTLGCRQAVRHQTLTLTFPGFESLHPSQKKRPTLVVGLFFCLCVFGRENSAALGAAGLEERRFAKQMVAVPPRRFFLQSACALWTNSHGLPWRPAPQPKKFLGLVPRIFFYLFTFHSSLFTFLSQRGIFLASNK